jgi:hypothetical protein
MDERISYVQSNEMAEAELRAQLESTTPSVMAGR